MRRKYNLVYLLVIFLSTVGIMGMMSCSRQDAYYEEIPDDKWQQTEGDWVPLEFSFESSEMMTPQTRALSEKGENQINQSKTRMLVFAEDGKFVYEAKITSITPTVDNQSEGQVKLLAKDSGGVQHTFVMLVNVDSSVEVNSGDLLSNVLEKFTFTTGGTWSDGTLPMWGEVKAVVNHTESTVPKLGTIHLIRAVARVDIGLNLTKDGTSQFNEIANGIDGVALTTVRLYNTNQSGLVAPNAANWDANKLKALQPSLPAAVTKIETIDKSRNNIQDGKLLLREIYLPEAANDNSTTTDYLTRPYIIVGLEGLVEGDATKETYFRIDYLEKTGDEPDATYTYLPLLRNHRYLVNITKVGGPGFDTIEDAQKGPAANIMYDVVIWNESKMTNVQYDGQYMLAVNPDKLTFYKDGGKLTSTIHTSFPKGFTIEGLPEWITHEIKPADSEKTGDTDEKIVTFTAEPTDAERTFTDAYVKAGRMKWNLHFEQKNEVNVEIGIFSDPECTQPLDFIEISQFGKAYDENNSDKNIVDDQGGVIKKEDIAIRTFYVKTEPNKSPTIKSRGYSDFIINPVANATLEADGIYTFTVTAEDLSANNIEFESYTVVYDFSITHPTETSVSASASLTLLQREYNAIPFYEKELITPLFENKPKFYTMDGSEVYFFMQANTEYVLKYLYSTDAQNNKYVDEHLLVYNEIKDPLHKTDFTLKGDPISFHTIDDLSDPKYLSGMAYFEVSSPNSEFPTKTFHINLISAIKQPEANTYMIKAGSQQGILIPLSRINTARAYYDRLLDADEFAYQKISGLKSLPGISKEPYRLDALEDDDEGTVEIVWTDIDGTETSSPIAIDGVTGPTPTEKAGLSLLKIFDGGTGKASDDFILVRAGKKPGNVSIAYRSSKGRKPILWSWHIWILDNYPTLIDIPKPTAIINDVEGVPLQLMSHIIGAKLAVTTNYGTYVPDEAGLQYQWGRKDPFPTATYATANPFYDENHNLFDFKWYQIGDGKDLGKELPAEVRGITLTVKESIQKPYTIVAHQSFWQYELFPHAKVEYFAYKSTFRFLWDNPGNDVDLMNYREADKFCKLGLKTVFDPSPYGFRIMSFRESATLKEAYRTGTLKSPITLTVYDGNYYSGDDVSKYTLFAVRFPWVAPGTSIAHAGRQLKNTSGGSGGWTSTSIWTQLLRRGTTFSVRPVRDTKEAPSKNDYTKYLPQ